MNWKIQGFSVDPLSTGFIMTFKTKEDHVPQMYNFHAQTNPIFFSGLFLSERDGH